MRTCEDHSTRKNTTKQRDGHPLECYMNVVCSSWTYNSRQLQSVLGDWVYFCALRSTGLTMNNIVASFTNNTAFNDYYVHLLVENRKLKFECCICVLSEKTHTTIFCFINTHTHTHARTHARTHTHTHTTIITVRPTSTCDHKQSRKLLHQSVNDVTVFSTKSQFTCAVNDILFK